MKKGESDRGTGFYYCYNFFEDFRSVERLGKYVCGDNQGFREGRNL